MFSSPPKRPLVDDMPSLFTAALPASIQSRLPKMPSIRRTVKVQAAFFRTESSTTLIPTPSLSSSPSSSPPASSRPSTSYADSTPPSFSVARDGQPDQPLDRAQTATVLLASQADKEFSSRRIANPSWSSTGISQPVDCSLVLPRSTGARPEAVSPSQVNWKYGQNGLRTLEQALREAGDPDRLPALERQIYIESVAYLLRGLPSDLHSGEQQQLRHAAPGVLLDEAPLVLSDRHALLAPPLAICPPVTVSDDKIERSLPHAVTHWVITRIYALVVLLFPVVTRLARLAMELDRRYRVQEAVLAWGSAVFLVLYRYAVDLFVAVCSMGDGRVGRAVDDGATLLANEVAAGFREAVYDVARGKA